MDPSHNYTVDENFNFVERVDYVESESQGQSAQSTSASISTSVGPSLTRANKRSKSSEVWHHFTVKEGVNVKGAKEPMAFCNYCQKALTCKTSAGTGHLKRHSEKCRRNHEANDPRQSQLAFGPGGEMKPFLYDHKDSRTGLALYIAAAEQPLQFAENEHFEHYMQRYAQPKFKKVPRNTIKRDIANLFEKKQLEIIDYFTNFNGIISVTSDCWTGGNNLGYICLTSHFVNENWILEKKLLSFKELEYPHSGAVIFNAILNIFQEYNVMDKIFSITLDNASANTVSVQHFLKNITPARGSQFFHIRCVCHIINLIVQDGLEFMSDSLTRIRNVLSMLRSSCRQQEFWTQILPLFGLKKRKFKLDIKTRWNSTYLMLVSCIEYRNAISHYAQTKSIEIYDLDWEIAQKFLTFLKVFYDATLACSTIYESSSCKVLSHLYNISDVIHSYCTDEHLRVPCLKMREKFLKYWSNIPHLFVYASLMDPLYSKHGTTELVNGIAKNLNVKLDTAMSEYLQSIHVLYNVYESKYGSRSSSSQSMRVRSEQSEQSNETAAMRLIRKGKSPAGCSGLNVGFESELEKWFKFQEILNTEYENIDVLQFWKEKSTIFPILSIMVRDLLTPPVSSVASESTFSTGGRVLDDRRTRLASSTLNHLMCLQDWESADRRTQQRWRSELFTEMSSLNMNSESVNVDASNVDVDDDNDDDDY